MNLEIKEITNFLEEGKNKTKLVFSEDKNEKEIILEGDGRLQSAVAEV